VNKEKFSQHPALQVTTTVDNPEHNISGQPSHQVRLAVNEKAPSFSTPVGFALWDVHNRRYPDRLVPHADAADIARLKVSTLTTMRSRKAGPPFVRIFGSPYYDLVDLIRWIEEKMEFSRA
jgi:hypothetical protein